MPELDWAAITQAYKLVQRTLVSRVDGPTWKVYRTNDIIRVDIEDKNE